MIPTASAPRSCDASGPQATRPGAGRVRQPPNLRRGRRMTSARLSSSDQRLRPHRHRPRHHAVRRGRRRLRGRRPRWSVVWSRSSSAERSSCARSQPSPSPRRPGRVYIEARRELQERAAGPAGLEADRCRTASHSSTACTSARCTPSPSGCCRAPGRSAAAAEGRGARRGVLGRGLRPALGPHPRPAPRRPRARAHDPAAPRGQRRPRQAAIAGAGLRRFMDLVDDLVPQDALRHHRSPT